MAYYKRDLLEFVDEEKDRVLSDIESKWAEKINARKQEVLSEYGDKMKEVSSLIGELGNKITDLTNSLKNDERFEYNPYYYLGVEDLKYRINLNSVEDMIYSSTNFSVHDNLTMELHRKKSIEYSESESAFKALYAQCKAMSSGSKIAQLLTELGYDIEYLDNNPSNETQLINPLDITKLHIPPRKESAEVETKEG